MGLNEDTFLALNGAGNPVLDPLMIAFGVVGLFFVTVLWAIPLWLARRRREAVDLLALLVATEAIVFVLKWSLAAVRPFDVLPARVLAIPLDDVTDPAFPSGHTARAFAAALLMTLRTKDWRWGVSLFAYATVMGLSRIYVGVHWPSDVLGGAVLGLAVAAAVERLTRIPWYGNTRDRIVERLASLRRQTS